MSMQQIKRWGHDFLRIRGGDIQAFGPMGKIQMSKGEPIKTVNYLSCLIHPIIYYCQKLVELVIAWDGQGLEVKIRIGQSTNFWKNVFWLMSQVNAQNCFPFPHSFMFSSFLTFLGSSLTFFSSILHSHWALMQLNLPFFLSFMWSVVFLIFHAREICFCVVEWMDSKDSWFWGS